MIQTIVSTANAEEPITLSEAKDQVRIYTTELDEQLNDAISEMREFSEVFTARTLRTTVTRKVELSCWPPSPFRIPWPPLIAISSIKYFDTAGDEQTVSSGDYRVHLSTELQGQVEFISTWSAPALFDRIDAVAIEYTSGYGTLGAVPRNVKRAMKILLSVEFDDVPIGRENNARQRAMDCLTASDWGSYL